jgi:5'(3')-deoxyribonucleotidase
MFTIYFDMDGTIADLYGVNNWLPKLRSENSSPYVEAMPLVDTYEMEYLLKELQHIGYTLGIISWTAKNGSKSYNKAVRKAKLEWLVGVFPEIEFDEIHIIKYGTRKDYVAKDKYGMIFDDDEKVREKWRGEAINPNTADIIENLKKLVELSE